MLVSRAAEIKDIIIQQIAEAEGSKGKRPRYSVRVQRNPTSG